MLNKVQIELNNLVKIQDKNFLEITEISKKNNFELMIFTEYLPEGNLEKLMEFY